MTKHKLTLAKNVKSNMESPFAQRMYNVDCPKQMRFLEKDEKVKLLLNRHLYIDYGSHVEIYAKGFCLENFYSEKNDEVHLSAFLCTNDKYSMYLVTPHTSKSKTGNDINLGYSMDTLHRWLRFFFTLFGLISLFFLFLCLFFYLTLPELQNFQGNIVCAYLTSMALTTILLVTIYNIRLQSEHVEAETEFSIVVSHTTCKTLGYLLYHSGLLMCSWMSLLCFDLLRYHFN